jgi:DNA modification methylase
MVRERRRCDTTFREIGEWGSDTVTVTHIKDLVADPENRRKHNPRNLGMVVDALHAVGAARSIVIDEGNVVLAGNGVTEAAAEAGITKVHVVDVDGSTLVAVRRTGLSPEQKRALAMYDNRTAELAEWNGEQLQADLDAGLDLQPWFSEAELATALRQAGGHPGLTDPDALPDARPTSIVRGDLFALGPHRLLCGDATVEADVARLLHGCSPHLMVTDPPYGVDYDPAWRDRAAQFSPSMGNRKDTATGTVLNDDRADWTAAWRLFPGEVAYVWHAGIKAADVAVSLAAAGFEVRSQIIWAKSHLAVSRSHYHWQHEPCWYAVRKGATGHWTGDRKQTTLWAIEKPQKSETGHATQKPVECMRRPIDNNSAPGQCVYDPFCGSGTTLIAAHQTGRVCLAIELNPAYVQLAIDRWEQFSGSHAVRVEAEHAAT